MALLKDGSIRITADQISQGIAPSQFVGLGKVVNLDIHSTPGVVKIAKALLKESPDSGGGEVNAIVVASSINSTEGITVVLDSNGVLYKRDNSSRAWSELDDFAENDGMIFWKDCAIVANVNSAPDTITLRALGFTANPAGSGDHGVFDTITSSSISAGYTVPMFVSIGDSLYIGAGRYLSALTENDTKNFDPTDNTTWTLSDEVLVLPEGYEISAIRQVGSQLLIGTTYGGSATIGDVLVWDPNKSGTGAADADQRIQTGEDGVRNMEVIGSLAYILAGKRGNVFVTNTTQTEQVSRLNNFSRYPDSDTNSGIRVVDASTVHDGGILFTNESIESGEGDTPNIYFYKNGVWSSFTISQGEDTDSIEVYSIISVNSQEYLVGWENETDSTYGVDALSTTKRYTSYAAYFESQFYNLNFREGGQRPSKTYQSVGIRLAKPLASGQGIRVKYRTSVADSYTTLATYDFATWGAVTVIEDKPGFLSKMKNVQFRVEMTTGSGDNPGTPELLEFYVI